jgi:hypothetical protein
MAGGIYAGVCRGDCRWQLSSTIGESACRNRRGRSTRISPVDSQELRQLIGQPEGLKLDFKRKLHKIYDPDRDYQKRHRDGFIRDILSLTNGNFGRLAKRDTPQVPSPHRHPARRLQVIPAKIAW